MVAGGRLTDWISLGVLASWVPADAVDDAVEATGRQAQRRGGKLPPRVVAYLVMALALFAHEEASPAEEPQSPAGSEAAFLASHAGDAPHVIDQDTLATSILMQGLAPVIASLESTRNAVVSVCALLVLKINGDVTVHHLTVAQQRRINRQPALLANPQQILAALYESGQGEVVPVSGARSPRDLV